jgi:uncharacterized protein YdaU (DUF1376 family)
MAKAPFMPLYTSDYLGDTGHLSTEEHGAYLLILMQMWNAGGSLPADPSKLARVARCSTKKWLAMQDTVLAFFNIDGDQISSNRLTKERQKVEAKTEVRRSAGAKGGAAKALKTKERPIANAIAKPCHSPDAITIEETIAIAIVAPQPPDPPESKSTGRVRGSARGNRIAPNWAPTITDYAFASSEGMTREDINREADKFRDYWIAKSGREACKLDWSATWRNWVRSDFRKRNGSGSGNASRNGGRTEAFDRLAERLQGGSDRADAWQHDDPATEGGYVIDASPTRITG